MKTATNWQTPRAHTAELADTPKVLCVGETSDTHRHETMLSACGCEIVRAVGRGAAERVLERNPDILVGLVFLKRQNCEYVDRLISRHEELHWIAIVEDADSEFEPIQDIIANLFFDYHTLPIDVDRLTTILGHARGVAYLRRTLQRKLRDGDKKQVIVHDMIGTSEAMRAVYTKIEKVAPTRFPVLITGQSGTGKELVARAIHRGSQRSEQSFVAVNCGAIVPTLIQSELFGHERGSFTSADRRRVGHFEAANGGTIFLDEVSELPLEAQANLLRVLEEEVVRRVGSSSDLPMDVRIIAATNRDLSQAVTQGKFREDLLYRLTVIGIEIPPLHERHQDIESLASYYLDKLTSETGIKTRGFAKNAIDAMHLHTWPGNVRELINRINNAALLCENRLIHAQDLGLGVPTSNSDPNQGMTLKEIKEKAERDAIQRTLERNNLNMSLAARALGVSRVTLYKLARKYGIRE